MIVIDNASADGSCEFLKKKFPWIKLISLPENIGFGRANNIGIKEAGGKYILFLNPDTILPENVLTDVLAFMQQTPDAGALGLRMIDGSGNFLPESKRSFPTPLNSFYKLSGLTAVFPHSKRINQYALGYIDEYSIAEVEVLSGAFFLSTQAILQKIQGFDEAFFMYGEDIDLSFRIKKEGYKIYYLGNQSILHFKGESTKEKNLNYIKMFYSAMEIFINKHYQPKGKKAFAFFLKSGVYVMGSINFLKNSLKKIIGKPKRKEKNSFLLSGDRESIKEARDIISKRLKNATVSMEELENIYNTNKPVIFCFGSLSYADAINFINEKKAVTNYLFHGKNTDSIVGSPSKNTTGIIFNQ